jgi:chaperonin GroEL (HSP60 family)
MTSQPATVSAHTLIRVEEVGTLPEGRQLSRGVKDASQIVDLKFDCGYLSPFFMTDPERMEVVFKNVYILIHEGKISAKKDLLKLLGPITKNRTPLLIIADDVEGEALATLVVKKLRGLLQVAAVRAPGFEDQRRSMLQNIARLTGGKTISQDSAMRPRDVLVSDLGQAKMITIDKKHTTIEIRLPYKPRFLEPKPCTSQMIIRLPGGILAD